MIQLPKPYVPLYITYEKNSIYVYAGGFDECTAEGRSKNVRCFALLFLLLKMISETKNISKKKKITENETCKTFQIVYQS